MLRMKTVLRLSAQRKRITRREGKKALFRINKITELAHFFAAMAISEGDLAVDATAGNGHDTLFLAEKVGPSGYVYAFDIQEEALCKTAERLKENNLMKRVKLIRAGHEELSNFVKKTPLSAVLYNLGYLPGGSRQVKTEANSTLSSLRQALDLIKPGGVITVVLYPGHAEGKREKEVLLPYCRNLSPEVYAVLHNETINGGHNPPELLLIQKILFLSDHNV